MKKMEIVKNTLPKLLPRKNTPLNKSSTPKRPRTPKSLPKTLPQTSQMGPKTLPNPPKSSPNPPKTVPKSIPTGSWSPTWTNVTKRIDSKRPTKPAKDAQERPKDAPDRPKPLPNGAPKPLKSNLVAIFYHSFPHWKFALIFLRFFTSFLHMFISSDLTKHCKNLGFFNVFASFGKIAIFN